MPGAHSEMYLVATPPGDWPYLLDTMAVVYQDGPWPFRPETGAWRDMRFSPGAADYSWSKEYVTLRPSFWSDAFAEATLRLYLGRHGAQHFIVNGKIRLDLEAGTAHVHEDVHGPVRDQAQMKADRLLAAVAEHRAARDRGTERPLTAWAYWNESPSPDSPQGTVSTRVPADTR